MPDIDLNSEARSVGPRSVGHQPARLLSDGAHGFRVGTTRPAALLGPVFFARGCGFSVSAGGPAAYSALLVKSLHAEHSVVTANVVATRRGDHARDTANFAGFRHA